MTKHNAIARPNGEVKLVEISSHLMHRKREVDVAFILLYTSQRFSKCHVYTVLEA